MYTNLRMQLNKEAKLKTSDDDDDDGNKERLRGTIQYIETNCGQEKIIHPPKLHKTIAKSEKKPKMQRKYNMALQHFYQAATHTTDEDDMKARLSNLSGSEEDLFTTEKGKSNIYEVTASGKDANKNPFFPFKNAMSVKQVKPVSICSLRSLVMCLVWFFLFAVGLLSITYFIQLAVSKIKANDYTPQPIVYERYNEKLKINHTTNVESCSDFQVEKIWHQTFNKFQTESAVRLVDVNKDGYDDIITGFQTSLDSYGELGERREICNKYYRGEFPCFGGAFAIDGFTGKELWIHYSWHDIYAVNCNGDINNDGVPDCLIAGRGGVFELISGKDGTMIWMFLDSEHRSEMMNFYTPQFINDMDGDGVMDVLQIHGGDPFAEPNSKERKTGKILFVSGKTGFVLKAHLIPDNTESYFSPVIYTFKNGSDAVVIGNGGETHPGSLYVIQLEDLYEGNMKKMVRVLSDDKKGFMNPPVLVDINKDGVVDLINAGYNDTISAIDGETLKVIWQYRLPDTETYSVPAVGYYNEDDVVDFMVKMNTGPGFPVYYNAKTIVLDGSNGKELTMPYKTSAPAHSSPLVVSMEGYGNDLFLHWSVDCEGHEHHGGAYKFVSGTNVHESSRADSCKLRYDTSSFSKLYVTNRNIGLPGKAIYFSGDYKDLEHGIYKRHIGLPDHGGSQRILQTGAIVPSYSDNKDELTTSFDVVFATYYIRSPNVRALLPSDMKCIKDYRKLAQKGKVQNKVDVDGNLQSGIYDEGDTAVNTCIKQRYNGTTLDNQESATKKAYDKGKLTVYRFKVTCKCDQGKKCAKVLPKNDQGWTGYMGSLANGYFKTRPAKWFYYKRETKFKTYNLFLGISLHLYIIFSQLLIKVFFW